MTFTELTAISQLTSGSAEGVASFALGLDDTSVALNITTILIVIGGITYLVFMALPSNPAGAQYDTLPAFAMPATPGAPAATAGQPTYPAQPAQYPAAPAAENARLRPHRLTVLRLKTPTHRRTADTSRRTESA